MNTPVTFNDLDQMAAEVLPERTVLSVIVTPAGGGGAVDSGGGTAILSSCQTTTTYTEPGVTGVLGLGFNATPVQTTTCTPAAIAS